MGALGGTLTVQRVRLACRLWAPPRIWTFLGSLRVSRLLLNLELESVETTNEAVDRVDDAALVDEHVVDLHGSGP